MGMKNLLILLLSFALAFSQILYNPREEEKGVPILRTEEERCMAVANGTRIQILGGPYTYKEVLGRDVAVGMPKIYKVKILEGECKDVIGYVLEIHIVRPQP